MQNTVKNTSCKMPTSNLMTLPTELQELIIDFLDFPSKAPLKHTNRYFNTLVKETDIYEAENSQHAVLHRLWACKECKFLLPSSQFSDNSMRGLRSKSGRKATKRFCVPCGLKKRPNGKSLYSPGQRIVIGGTLHFICRNCLQFKKCQEIVYSLCDECFEVMSMSGRIRRARLEAEGLKERIRRRAAELERYGSV